MLALLEEPLSIKTLPRLPTQDELPSEDGVPEEPLSIKTFPRLPTQDELPSEDGVPMETEQHRLQMELLINTLKPWLGEHQKGYVGGNLFIYFSQAQLKHQNFLGPDVFVVVGATAEPRKSWVVWEEGQGPDVVIELLSETTAKHDKSDKKQIYQNQLRVAEYFWFDPFQVEDWAGFDLNRRFYVPKAVDAKNRLICNCLELALTRWHGVHQGVSAVWLRWETLAGELLPTPEERVEQQKQRADQEKQRADQQQRRADQQQRRAEQEKQRADHEKQRAEKMEAYLKTLGINPEQVE